jgi:hypothetical protein
VIPCLRSNDVVLVCCEVDGGEVSAQWVQINPAVYPAILGTVVEVVEPKRPGSDRYSIRIPRDLSMVHTDVNCPIVPVDS